MLPIVVCGWLKSPHPRAPLFRELGLRARILTLPLMVAAVLTLLWRDVPGVTELGRLLEAEGLLGARSLAR